MKPSSQWILVLALGVISLGLGNTAYAQSYQIEIPITFDELDGVSGGTFTTTITDDGFTWIYLTGITNNNPFDIENLQHEMSISNNGVEFCNRSGSVSPVPAGGSVDLEWYCVVPGIADKAVGGLISYDIPQFTASLDGDCINYQNPPFDGNSVWLLAPQADNEAYYHEDGQWLGGANIPGGSICGDHTPGDYKFAVFSEGLSGFPDVSKILEWSNIVTVEAVIEDVEEVVETVETTESTTTENTSNSTSTTSSTSSSSSNDEPTNEITTSFVVGNHEMSIIVADYVGTSKFVTFTGDNFVTSDTLTIEITDSNNIPIVDIQTIVNGGGYFSVPAIVDTSSLSDENYNVILKSKNSDDLAFVVYWTGAVFSFENEIIPTISTDTSTDTSTSSTTSTSTSTGTDWNQFVLDLSFEDRLDLIKAVFSYILG